MIDHRVMGWTKHLLVQNNHLLSAWKGYFLALSLKVKFRGRWSTFTTTYPQRTFVSYSIQEATVCPEINITWIMYVVEIYWKFWFQSKQRKGLFVKTSISSLKTKKHLGLELLGCLRVNGCRRFFQAFSKPKTILKRHVDAELFQI